MNAMRSLVTFVSLWVSTLAVVQLPSFRTLKYYYPGYRHFGGRYGNRKLVQIIGVRSHYLLHDTSALRLSYTFNKIGKIHSLGKRPISFSVHGKDSLPGRNGQQFIFHPISYGPYLADKYGYPTVSRVQTTDSLLAKIKFWGLQGVVRVLTYTKIGNHPKGHVALWDCDHFYKTKDWMKGHTLLTVEFWMAPDSDCSRMKRTEGTQRTRKRIHAPISNFMKEKTRVDHRRPKPGTNTRPSNYTFKSRLVNGKLTRKYLNSIRDLTMLGDKATRNWRSDSRSYWRHLKRLHRRHHHHHRHHRVVKSSLL